MPIRVIVTSIVAVVLATPVSAGFEEGKRAALQGDYAVAYQEWRPLAEEGHADAQFLLGLMYREGRAVPQDSAEAVLWLEKAAAQGHSDARFFLARAYREGRGVAQDFAEAARWFLAAAEQGHAKAAFTIGLMYRKGEGVRKDDREAARWYQKAALLGHAEARFTLGAVSEEGRGVEQDFVRAYAWYSLAETSGIELGAVLRQRAARRMTPGQIAEAQALAKEWRAGPKAPSAEDEEAGPAAEGEAVPAVAPASAVVPEIETAPPGQIAETQALAKEWRAGPKAPSAEEVEAGPVAEGEPAPAVAPETETAPPGQAPAAERPAPDQASVAVGEKPAQPPRPARTYRVRLASYRSPEGSNRGWEILSKAHPDLLGELGPSVHRVDLGPGKGVYFRLEAGPLGDRAAARALCAALKRRQLDCLIVEP